MVTGVYFEDFDDFLLKFRVVVAYLAAVMAVCVGLDDCLCTLKAKPSMTTLVKNTIGIVVHAYNA